MPRVVLVGSGGSGSTLLGMSLALSPQVTNLGEVAEFTRAASAATCGTMFDECPLWGEVLGSAITKGWSTARLLRTVAERAEMIEKTRWCVDSVKSRSGWSAETELGLEEGCIIHLVRHPCGYVYTQLLRGVTFPDAIGAWIEDQDRSLRLEQEVDAPARMLRYEDLANDPGAGARSAGRVHWRDWALRRVLVSVGLGPRRLAKRPALSRGRRMALRGKPERVAEDVRWQHALRPEYQRRSRMRAVHCSTFSATDRPESYRSVE